MGASEREGAEREGAEREGAEREGAEREEHAAFETTAPGQSQARAAEQVPTTLSGLTVGDYVFGDVIGSGGMGVIYAAVDAKLQRKVAIKVILRKAMSSATDASTRLLREAQAMARLSHANVVTIYQVGTIDDQVFVAMELINGQTLRQWLDTQRPTWQHALDVMVQAGRGLQAAHDAGIIHRDFKPDNILIGNDGRVLVTDFGIARAAAGIETPVPDAVAIDKHENLTMTGAILGTPAYMAPEQHRGTNADARSDQYSYGLALYEAVYGHRPFAGTSWDELMLAKDEGKIQTAPSRSSVPRWLRSIMLQALRVNPDDRFPSMREVLAAIERGRARRRGSVMLASAGGALVVAAVIGAVVVPGDRNPGVACDEGSSRITAIWNATAKERVHTAFLASAQPFAQETLAYANKHLDRYAGEWQRMYRDTCQATHSRGEQSSALLDRRMSCLARRVHEVQAVVDLFVAADALIVAQAAEAVNGLSQVEDCAPSEAMSAAAAKGISSADRKSIERLSADLARVKALASSARTEEGLALAQRVAVEAKAAGHAGGEAEAVLLEGRLQAAAGRFDLARAPTG